MALELYYHPFSAYSWKALIALYETGTAFLARSLEDPENSATLHRVWPIGKFPVLMEIESGLVLPEASLIIEYLDRHHPGTASMLPSNEASLLETRLLDRVFDNYVAAPMMKIVADRMREADRQDHQGVEEARALLTKTYGWLETRLAGRTWASGTDFTLADCAAAPFLFYADWVHPIGSPFPLLSTYRARLLARPSVKRVVDEARPFRSYFPGGAPDRD